MKSWRSKEDASWPAWGSRGFSGTGRQEKRQDEEDSVEKLPPKSLGLGRCLDEGICQGRGGQRDDKHVKPASVFRE